MLNVTIINEEILYNKVDYIIHEKFYTNRVTIEQFRFIGSWVVVLSGLLFRQGITCLIIP
jgi:hypothetical protein